MSAPQPPVERDELDHAGRAADHILALVVAKHPTYQVTAEAHDCMVEMVQAVARLLASGRDA
jgi:hypothetical protein